MISLEKAKIILNQNSAKYTIEQIDIVREKLYILAELDYQIFNNNIKSYEKNSSHLYESFD